MGCGLASQECTENGDGFRIRSYNVLDSGFGNTLRYNRFERIGYNGVDVFGPENTLESNFITQACYSKADCGGVRTFGDDSLAQTGVYNLYLADNIILDIPGNVDGCHASRPPFGMGLYIDNYSRDVQVSGNTIISTTITGILYQRSSGVISGNTVFNASSGTAYSAQISLSGSQTQVSLQGNALYGLKENAWTLYTYDLSNILASDDNHIFHPYVDEHIAYGPSWERYTFAGWQAFSGQEGLSSTNWFSQARRRAFARDDLLQPVQSAPGHRPGQPPVPGPGPAAGSGQPGVAALRLHDPGGQRPGPAQPGEHPSGVAERGRGGGFHAERHGKRLHPAERRALGWQPAPDGLRQLGPPGGSYLRRGCGAQSASTWSASGIPSLRRAALRRLPWCCGWWSRCLTCICPRWAGDYPHHLPYPAGSGYGEGGRVPTPRWVNSADTMNIGIYIFHTFRYRLKYRTGKVFIPFPAVMYLWLYWTWIRNLPGLDPSSIQVYS